jgi:hypothetical protein
MSNYIANLNSQTVGKLGLISKPGDPKSQLLTIQNQGYSHSPGRGMAKKKRRGQESIIFNESPPPDGSDLQERRRGKVKEALIISVPINYSILSSPPGTFSYLPLGQIGFENDLSFMI